MTLGVVSYVYRADRFKFVVRWNAGFYVGVVCICMRTHQSDGRQRNNYSHCEQEWCKMLHIILLYLQNALAQRRCTAEYACVLMLICVKRAACFSFCTTYRIEINTSVIFVYGGINFS